MPRKFVVITMQRSGSNMLDNILGEHPEVASFGELMRTTPAWMRKTGYRGALRNLLKVNLLFRLDWIRFAFPYAFVNRVFALPYGKDKEVVGFKLHIGQHNRFMRRLIHDPEYALIVLQRENILAQHSSWLIAEETGQGNARKGDAIRRARIEFSPNLFKSYVERVEGNFSSTRELIEQSGKKPFELTYMELGSREKNADMFEFLGVDNSIVPEPQTQKRNSSHILSRFSNPDDVQETLQEMGRTEWAKEGAK